MGGTCGSILTWRDMMTEVAVAGEGGRSVLVGELPFRLMDLEQIRSDILLYSPSQMLKWTEHSVLLDQCN
jgi:hypothetical protein